ncbi:MAG: calcineurin-like phosphoesterase C-terminal domain-containing protein [Planctomycetaceae bacterium]
MASATADEPVLVTVNVFNGSEKTNVEMRVDEGEWTTLPRVPGVDPKYQRTFDAEAAILAQTPNFRKLPTPRVTGHLWQGPIPTGLSPGTHRIDVRATDHWGRVFDSHRILRVEE